jgi:hypothetical protein
MTIISIIGMLVAFAFGLIIGKRCRRRRERFFGYWKIGRRGL